jgi:glycogen synthase
MRILQISPQFYPTVGGVPFVVRTLAKEWIKMAHSCKIITAEPLSQAEDSLLGVIRAPSLPCYIRALYWAEQIVIHQDAISLAWPSLFCPKPTMMVLHVNMQKRGCVGTCITRLLVSKTKLFAVSNWLAGETEQQSGYPCGVISNPYDSAVFHDQPMAIGRDIDFCFVGRLGVHKGCEIFVSALSLLFERGVHFRATIIGDGPERQQIEDEINRKRLGGCVEVLGQKPPSLIACTLRCTKFAVIPSHYEPFGIVALEARACGCSLIVSRTGGLPEAAGPDAHLVEAGNTLDLATKMSEVLAKYAYMSRNPDMVPSLQHLHLEKHEPANVAARYLHFMEDRGANSVKCFG